MVCRNYVTILAYPDFIMFVFVDQDGAEPSPNSVSVNNLLRLYFMLKNEEYQRRAEKCISAFGKYEIWPIFCYIFTTFGRYACFNVFSGERLQKMPIGLILQERIRAVFSRANAPCKS